jgi:hypothetical protein
MPRQSVIPQKKKRGPSPTGKGEPVMVRVQPPLMAALDAWIASQSDEPSRPEAIRRIVERTLAGRGRARAPSKNTAYKASKMAARELEPLGDKTMAPDERDRRKRALIRGPKEFRDIRGDQPKTKR